MRISIRIAAVTAGATLAFASTVGVAMAKTISDSAYAARVCGEVAAVLEPLVELRAVDTTDLAAYQEAAAQLLEQASEAAEDAEESLANVTSKSGGKKAARTFDFFFGERANAYEAAGREIENGDPTDSSFASEIRAFVDILNDAPFGLATPFDATTITKRKALVRAFEDDETCVAVRVEFD